MLPSLIFDTDAQTRNSPETGSVRCRQIFGDTGAVECSWYAAFWIGKSEFSIGKIWRLPVLLLDNACRLVKPRGWHLHDITPPAMAHVVDNRIFTSIDFGNDILYCPGGAFFKKMIIRIVLHAAFQRGYYIIPPSLIIEFFSDSKTPFFIRFCGWIFLISKYLVYLIWKLRCIFCRNSSNINFSLIVICPTGTIKA